MRKLLIVAVSLGLGLAATAATLACVLCSDTWSQSGGGISVEARVKDYFASFKSVDDAAALGVSGRRAHTVGFLIGVSIGL